MEKQATGISEFQPNSLPSAISCWRVDEHEEDRDAPLPTGSDAHASGRFTAINDTRRHPSDSPTGAHRHTPSAPDARTCPYRPHPGNSQGVRHFAESSDSKYCGTTLDNYESYAADVGARNYLHYPTAGVTGLRGSNLVLSPDEERFSLEPSGFESFEVNLQSESLQ